MSEFPSFSFHVFNFVVFAREVHPLIRVPLIGNSWPVPLLGQGWEVGAGGVSLAWHAFYVFAGAS